MKRIPLSILIIILFILQSCKNDVNTTNLIKDDWDFTNQMFKDKNVRLLNGYDVFEITQKSDSIIVLRSTIFQGWKNKSYEISDTLRLTEKYFVQDSLGNRIQQLVSYSNRDETYFQLIITKKETAAVDGTGTSKKEMWFDYKGKLFSNKKSFRYFDDFLYTK